MRTTVNLDERVLARAKERARADGRTLGELLEASLQRYLAAAPSDSGPELPVFRRGTGFAPGVDPTSNASLFEAADRHDAATT